MSDPAWHRLGAVPDLGGISRGCWIVDGNNVVGSRPDGWWRDRRAAFARFESAVSGRDWPVGVTVTVVFDGRGRTADDQIVDQIAEHPDRGGDTVVVTSDRELRDRVLELGAMVFPARRFLDLLEERADPEDTV